MIFDGHRHSTRLSDRLWSGRRDCRTVVARVVPHTVDRERPHIFICRTHRRVVGHRLIDLDRTAIAATGFDCSPENT